MIFASWNKEQRKISSCPNDPKKSLAAVPGARERRPMPTTCALQNRRRHPSTRPRFGAVNCLSHTLHLYNLFSNSHSNREILQGVLLNQYPSTFSNHAGCANDIHFYHINGEHDSLIATRCTRPATYDAITHSILTTSTSMASTVAL